MKRTILCLGILLMILAFGMAVVACDIPKDELDGTTWNSSDAGINQVLTFDSPNFTLKVYFDTYTPYTNSGTYTISGSTVTLTITEGETGTTTATLSGNKLTLAGFIFTKQ